MNGDLSFDFHGYVAKNRLVAYHTRACSERYPGWLVDIRKVDFDLLDTTSLNANKHLRPDQFWADPIARAADFLNQIDHPTAAATAMKNAALSGGVFKTQTEGSGSIPPSGARGFFGFVFGIAVIDEPLDGGVARHDALDLVTSQGLIFQQTLG